MERGAARLTIDAYQIEVDNRIVKNDWSLGPLHALTRPIRFGGYVESSNVASGDRRYDAKWIADLDIGYDISERLTVSIGANNLFNVYPDRNGVIAADGSGAYGNFAPFGLSGGFYYTRISARF